MKTTDENQQVDFNQFVELAQSHTPITAQVKGVNRNRDKHVAGVNVIVLGLKAFLPASELCKGESAEKLTGDIEVVVIKAEAESRRVVVSRKGFTAAAKKEAVATLGVGQVVSATIRKVSDAGAVASIEVNGNDVRAFIPRSHVRARGVKPQSVLKNGEKVNATILEINVKQGEVVLSLKRALAQGFLGSVEVDQTVEGTIVSNTEIGFFVNVGPMDGLLHVSQIPAGKELKVGDTLSVRIRSISLEKEQLGLTLLANQPQMQRRVTPSFGSRRTERVSNLAMFSTKRTHTPAPVKERKERPGVFKSFEEFGAFWKANQNNGGEQKEVASTEAAPTEVQS